MFAQKVWIYFFHFPWWWAPIDAFDASIGDTLCTNMFHKYVSLNFWINCSKLVEKNNSKSLNFQTGFSLHCSRTSKNWKCFRNYSVRLFIAASLQNRIALKARKEWRDWTKLKWHGLVFDELKTRQTVMHYSRHRLTASLANVTYASTNDEWARTACPLVSLSKTKPVNSVRFSDFALYAPWK